MERCLDGPADLSRNRDEELASVVSTAQRVGNPSHGSCGFGDHLSAFGFPTAQDTGRLEEELKLQYYYGGRDVVCLDTPEGRVVVAVGTPVIEDVSQILQSLDPDERRRIAILSPEPGEERVVSAPDMSNEQA